MSWQDKGRYRLLAGIANIGVGLFNVAISVITLGILIWKVV